MNNHRVGKLKKKLPSTSFKWLKLKRKQICLFIFEVLGLCSD